MFQNCQIFQNFNICKFAKFTIPNWIEIAKFKEMKQNCAICEDF